MDKHISGDVQVEIEWSFKSGGSSHVYVFEDCFDDFSRYDIIACALANFYTCMPELGVNPSELLVSVLCVSKSSVGGKVIL